MLATSATRRFTALLLLALFVLMKAVVVLHTHTVVQADADCEHCVQHTPHGVHFAAWQMQEHHCLACQLGAATYLPALRMALALPTPQADIHTVCYVACYAHPSLTHCQTRAPPSDGFISA